MSSRGYGFLWHNPGHRRGGVWQEYNTLWRAKSTRQMDYWITAGDTPADISLAYAKATGFAPEMPEYGLGLLAVQAALLEPGTAPVASRASTSAAACRWM